MDSLAPVRKAVWVLGVVSVLAGITFRIVFAGGSAATDSETQATETEVRRLRSALGRIESRVDATRLEIAVAEERLRASERDLTETDDALKTVRGSDPRLADDAEESLRSLREQIEAARVELARGREAPEPPAAESPPPSEAAPDSPRETRDHEVPSWLLDAYRPSLIAVVSSSLQVSTGIVLERSGSLHYVLTLANAAPHGAQVACLFPAKSPAGEETFETVMATETYRDSRGGLLLLACRPRSASELPPLSRGLLDGGPIATGDDLFAVCTQVRDDATFTHSIYEGVVSADSREADGIRFLQTTLPSNPGSLGAPVVSVRGDLVGVLCGKVPGLERQSLVVPCAELSRALVPMRQAMALEHGRRAAYAAPPGMDRGALESEVQERSLPYDLEDTFDLPNPDAEQPEVFPGPKDLVVLWDPKESRVSVWKRGRGSPVWTKRFDGRTRVAVAYRHWGPRLLVSSQAPRSSALEIDVARGGVVTTIPPSSGIGGGTLGQAWSCFSLGSYRVLALRSGIGLVNVTSGQALCFGRVLQLLGRNQDLFTVRTADGKLGWFTQSGTLVILARIDALLRAAEKVRASKKPDSTKYAELRRIAAQIQLLASELESSVKLFEAGELARSPGNPQAGFSHVPGTYTHIIGTSVWRIGPDGVEAIGTISPIRHSAGDEAWFHAYYDSGAQPCPMASPDGRYAVTDTHVFDLKELKPLVELPFPTGPAGFTSSGSLIYAHDRLHHRIVFLEFEELLATARGPYGADPGTPLDEAESQ